MNNIRNEIAAKYKTAWLREYRRANDFIDSIGGSTRFDPLDIMLSLIGDLGSSIYASVVTAPILVGTTCGLRFKEDSKLTQ